MGAFEYTALDAAGREQQGVLEGDTPRHVRQQLRERQLLPIKVEPVAEREASRQRTSFSFARRVSGNDVALLTRQLATLSKAGLPLEEALLAVSQQSEKPRVQSVLLGVRAKVMEGHALADGLADFPRVFPEIYRATVAAGEQAGHLDAVLERLADYTESRDELRQKILGALLYPIVLTIMCLGIVSGLLVYVVPKVVEVFESGKGKLPLMTRALIAVSDFLRDYGPWILLALVIGGIGFARWLRNPDARRRFHRLLLTLPLVGRLVRGFNTARFTRTFSILTGSAVPVLESLRIAGQVVSNLPMREAVEAAAQRVREGAPIGRALGQSRLFPPMTIHLISSGESSGELEDMLERAAISQERELDGILAALVGLLGPMLIVVMGLFVMGIVFAMLLPIFEMNTLIR
ncbi:MAG: type II secretion system inner membrane protein GspF [Steroidobacteraceae bacterium]|nr:type II secretion system inner membrane protein GspF [Nevskiaceae bacterium]MCP5340320.1 type II secretion system inner membrane protein GspF [Nevskiaceae bacterium]MCP5359691.1 type II secretion system inner membrane protein GspF [Nevskiaceae bacterium]